MRLSGRTVTCFLMKNSYRISTKELERSYNVKIHIANDSLKTFRFYGNFVRREQNIQEVLEALASTEKMQYKIEERNITIY